jgi:D-glycero-beta-D-manno-heptose-7-phosphate kinase
MVKIISSDYEKYIKKIRASKIAVIGDVMLDVYYWGRTERISPEAPVPVVNVTGEEIKPGGAANVALNIRSLGAEPEMYGIIGNDLNGSCFAESMGSYGIGVKNIIVDKKRPTTVKTRILASNQHVVRFDKENTDPIDKRTEKRILSELEKNIGGIDAVIFQDYNKGVLTPDLIRSAVKICSDNKVISTVDPKFKNFMSYKGAYLFKPNLRETEEILKRTVRSESEIEKAGIDLMDKLSLSKLVITLSERGMAIFDDNAIMTMIPARTTRIANVSGAGDTVIATLTSFLAAGATFEQACSIANYAASIVVEDVSIVPVKPEELKKRLIEHGVLERAVLK